MKKFKTITSEYSFTLDEKLNSFAEEHTVIDYKITQSNHSFTVVVCYEDNENKERNVELERTKQEYEEVLGALGTLRKINDELDTKIKRIEEMKRDVFYHNRNTISYYNPF